MLVPEQPALSAGLSESHVFETDGSGGSNHSSALLNHQPMWVWKSSGRGVLAVPLVQSGVPGARRKAGPPAQPLQTQPADPRHAAQRVNVPSRKEKSSLIFCSCCWEGRRLCAFG